MCIACMVLIKMRKKTKTKSVLDAANETRPVWIKKLGGFCCPRNLTSTRDEQKKVDQESDAPTIGQFWSGRSVESDK